MSGCAFNRVMVLMGGPSAEREVSLRSGAAVCVGLRAAGYTAEALDVDGSSLPLTDDVEAVFLALHGRYGEDGTVQGELNRLEMPYTGSGAAASRLAFDKILAKQALEAAGIPTPAYEVLDDPAALTLAFPVVVKPPREGSSIGVHAVRDAADWPAAAADVRARGDRLLVERFIAGREITVGVIDGLALPAVEIVAPDGWYDYRAKYTKGTTSYGVPADLTPAIAEACRKTALRAFEALGCRGAARVDFRLSESGTPYVLEINTIPGFTETSLLPMAAGAAGIAFDALCDRIMRGARTDGGGHGGES